ncbi:hypothetical protein PIB30_073721 [Stylosanthes scabra]|uniref:Uncharacterized protein n=1 Tax=Stylosanthes scabra TaxID=79078 RepID=A0ABU6XMB6_9FABA|nr:hypothetical protein [Stylosanthes scabra]
MNYGDESAYKEPGNPKKGKKDPTMYKRCSANFTKVNNGLTHDKKNAVKRMGFEFLLSLNNEKTYPFEACH